MNGISSTRTALMRRTSIGSRLSWCAYGVDQPLAHERGLEAARRAVGRGRRLVGEPEVAHRAIGARHAVRPRQHAAGHHRDARRMGAHIGAVVVVDHVVDRQDFALLGAGGAHLVVLVARVVGGDQVLAAILDPFHRTVEPHRGDADQHVLGIKLAANAKAAADMRLVALHRRRRPAEHARDQFLVPVRHLGGAVQLQHVARSVVAAERAARLQRHAGMAARGQVQLDDGMRGRKHRVDVAVALREERGLGVAAGRELAGLGPRVEQRRQFLDLDPRPVRRHPRRRRGLPRTPRRSARRRNAPCQWPAPAGGTARASRSAPHGNRSGRCRRCLSRSTPRPHRGPRELRSCRPRRCGRARDWNAPSACEADARN